MSWEALKYMKKFCDNLNLHTCHTRLGPANLIAYVFDFGTILSCITWLGWSPLSWAASGLKCNFATVKYFAILYYRARALHPRRLCSSSDSAAWGFLIPLAVSLWLINLPSTLLLRNALFQWISGFCLGPFLRLLKKKAWFTLQLPIGCCFFLLLVKFLR